MDKADHNETRDVARDTARATAGVDRYEELTVRGTKHMSFLWVIAGIAEKRYRRIAITSRTLVIQCGH